MNKVHYKMFKAGKKWMVAGIVTAAMSTGAFFVTSINANADVVSNASSYTGTPYSYGGTDNSGIDCSALVQNAYAADGVTLPRTSGAQYSATTPISAADAQPGDLVFFGNQGSDHVGIYSGNGNMINAETVDGVTSRQVSVMEKYLGAATYGRVNGGTQAASVNANVAADTSASDNTNSADTTDQNNAPVANTDETDTKILAPAPKADDQTAETTTTDANSATAETPVQATPDQASTDKDEATLTDASQAKTTETPTTDASTDNTQAAPVADAAATNQTATTNATPDQALNNNAVANATDANNSAANQTAVKNDNVVTLSAPAKPATDTTVAPAATSNKKAALPATGVKDNSFLSIIGLVLVSFVAMFGIKLRKNN
ncbi:NlpC/P60 family protein [Fructilactobacillus frigidiflavus]|uniref:NlpC/P60 family protein n=1 Tax=Fructilactobacillus frigidiflavus TaxID=3242688 RepID=UPI0037574629